MESTTKPRLHGLAAICLDEGSTVGGDLYVLPWWLVHEHQTAGAKPQQAIRQVSRRPVDFVAG